MRILRFLRLRSARKRPSAAPFLRSFVSYRPKGGQQNEERMMGIAIRKLRESPPPSTVVEVMNACHVDYAAQLFPLPSLLKQTPQRLRVLTRADLLSKEALQYQMTRAAYAGEGQNIAVVAMDLHRADQLPLKQLKPLLHVLAGARTDQQAVLVCGLPNAGKSSLIHALTKARTLQVRNKKHYHLPKISAQAGFTLGSKLHNVPHPLYPSKLISLKDTPGMRPRLQGLHPDALVHLLAAGCVEPPKGMLQDTTLRQAILQQLFQGLVRHARVSNQECQYASPQDLLATLDDQGKKQLQNMVAPSVLQKIMKRCREGALGGMILEPNPLQLPLEPFALGPRPAGSPVVAMNAAANRWRLIGSGKQPKETTQDYIGSTATTHTVQVPKQVPFEKKGRAQEVPKELPKQQAPTENTTRSTTDAIQVPKQPVAFKKLQTDTTPATIEGAKQVLLDREKEDNEESDDEDCNEEEPARNKPTVKMETIVALHGETQLQHKKQTNKDNSIFDSIGITSQQIEGLLKDTKNAPATTTTTTSKATPLEKMAHSMRRSEVAFKNENQPKDQFIPEVKEETLRLEDILSRNKTATTSDKTDPQLEEIVQTGYVDPAIQEKEERTALLQENVKKTNEYWTKRFQENSKEDRNNDNDDNDKLSEREKALRLWESRDTKKKEQTIGRANIGVPGPRPWRDPNEETTVIRTEHSKRRKPGDPRPRRQDYPKKDRDGRDIIVRLPEHQQFNIRCMKCAGFLRLSKDNAKIKGTAYMAISTWDEHDIKSFFSRMTEAFGVHLSEEETDDGRRKVPDGRRKSFLEFLMKDSLLRTLALKFKLKTRSRVYRYYGDEGIGFPVPNQNRKPYFQNHNPVPFGFNACSSQTKEACWKREDCQDYIKEVHGDPRNRRVKEREVQLPSKSKKSTNRSKQREAKEKEMEWDRGLGAILRKNLRK